MNQKNIFNIIGVVLLIQGIMFFTMKDKTVTDAFPYVEYNGHYAAGKLMEVMAVLSVLVGFITFGARNTPQVLWGYSLGFTLLTVLSLKHLLRDQINVPIYAIVIQVVITLACCYLWMQSRKSRA
jgi:hypothetical protein